MATVVKLPRDRRTELVGGGLGSIFGQILSARLEREREEEEERQRIERIKNAVQLFTSARDQTAIPGTEVQAGESVFGPVEADPGRIAGRGEVVESLAEAQFKGAKIIDLLADLDAAEQGREVEQGEQMLADALESDKTGRSILADVLRLPGPGVENLAGVGRALKTVEPGLTLEEEIERARKIAEAKARGKAAGAPAKTDTKKFDSVTLFRDGDERQVFVPRGTDPEVYITGERPDLLAAGFGFIKEGEEETPFSQELSEAEQMAEAKRKGALAAETAVKPSLEETLLETQAKAEAAAKGRLAAEPPLATRAGETETLAAARARGEAKGRPAAAPQFQAVRLFRDDGAERTVHVPKGVNPEDYIREKRPELARAGFGFEKDRPKIAQEIERDTLMKLGVPEGIATKVAAGALSAQIDTGTGRVAITDLTTQKTVFTGGDILTRDQLTRIDRKISSIRTAKRLLQQADPTAAGLENALTTSVGGLAIQVPIIGSLLEFMGLTETEVAQAQAKRAGLFATLLPVAESLRSDAAAGRFGVTTKQIEIAERIVNMTRLASTPDGAAMARRQLIDLLDQMEAELIVHRQSGRAIPPRMIFYDTFTDSEGKVRMRRTQ